MQHENSLTKEADSTKQIAISCWSWNCGNCWNTADKILENLQIFCPLWSSWGSSLYGKPGAWRATVGCSEDGTYRTPDPLRKRFTTGCVPGWCPASPPTGPFRWWPRPCCCWKWWRWTELGVVQTWGSLFDDLTHPNWDFNIFFRIGSWIELMESTKTGLSKIMASWSFMILHFFMFEFSFACFSTFYQQLSTNYITFWCILSRMKTLCWNHRLVAGVYHHKTSLARLVWVESSHSKNRLSMLGCPAIQLRTSTWGQMHGIIHGPWHQSSGDFER